MSTTDPIRDALEEFVDAVNATGGVTVVKNVVVPIGDTDWTDLGHAYLRACLALGIDPVGRTDDGGDINAYGDRDV